MATTTRPSFERSARQPDASRFWASSTMRTSPSSLMERVTTSPAASALVANASRRRVLPTPASPSTTTRPPSRNPAKSAARTRAARLVRFNTFSFGTRHKRAQPPPLGHACGPVPGARRSPSGTSSWAATKPNMSFNGKSSGSQQRHPRTLSTKACAPGGGLSAKKPSLSDEVGVRKKKGIRGEAVRSARWKGDLWACRVVEGRRPETSRWETAAAWARSRKSRTVSQPSKSNSRQGAQGPDPHSTTHRPPSKLETLRSRDLRFKRSRLSSPKAHFSRAFHKCRHRFMEPDSLDGEAGASTSIIAHRQFVDDGRLADDDGMVQTRSSS